MYAIWCSVRREFRLRKPCTKSVTEPPVQSYSEKWWQEKTIEIQCKTKPSETKWSKNRCGQFQFGMHLTRQPMNIEKQIKRNETSAIRSSDAVAIPLFQFVLQTRFDSMDFIIFPFRWKCSQKQRVGIYCMRNDLPPSQTIIDRLRNRRLCARTCQWTMANSDDAINHATPDTLLRSLPNCP